MAYLDYPGLAYFKSLLDENYLRTDYEGDTVINGDVTFINPIDASVKNDWLGQQIDKTYIKNLRPEDDGELALIYGDNHEEVITIDTAVTQVRSDANEMYPILLCYDANAEVNQVSKSVRYGHNVAINPAYGYVYANSYVVKHPTYNRTISATTRIEWASDFRDSVLNPVGQIFEYIDPVSSGGEHRMEFRLYGNPNVAGINTPNVNDETNTVSLGVSATRGDTLTFFGYAPSTPIYLEDGSTMRKSLVRGDQYGKDIITRDWLNLNGSITGLVHTYMDEAIDGYKTFLKTVTINSGDDNNKAGLNVQGDINVEGTVNKVSGDTFQEYVTYVTNQPDNREDIASNLIDGSKGLYVTSDGKIGVELQDQGGLKFNNTGGIYVDFTSATDDVKEAVLSGLGIQIPLTSDKTFYVNKEHPAATTVWRNNIGVIDKAIGTPDKPFKTIQSAVECATQGYSVGSNHIDIIIAKSSDAGYNEFISLPQFQHTTGYIKLISADTSSASNYAVITNKATTIDNAAARPIEGLVGCNGSGWRIENIKFDSQISNPGDGVAHFPTCLSAGANADVLIYGCAFSFAYSGAAPNGNTYMRMISATTGGVIGFRLMENSQTTISATLGNSTGLVLFFCERQGQINFNSVNWGSSNSSYHNISCSGSCSTFAYVAASSIFSVIGGASYPTKFTGNITGDACSVKSLSTCTTIEAFPSNLSAGTKDSSCYVSSIIPTA